MSQGREAADEFVFKCGVLAEAAKRFRAAGATDAERAESTAMLIGMALRVADEYDRARWAQAPLQLVRGDE